MLNNNNNYNNKRLINALLLKFLDVILNYGMAGWLQCHVHVLVRGQTHHWPLWEPCEHFSFKIIYFLIVVLGTTGCRSMESYCITFRTGTSCQWTHVNEQQYVNLLRINIIIMYLLTEWEGRTGKYLAWGDAVQTERSL